MKKTVLLITLIFMFSCSSNQHKYKVNNIIENKSKFKNKKYSIKGYLKISETQRKFLYVEPESKYFFDLALDLEILPEDQYIPETYYCVVVYGEFIDYVEGGDVIFMGSISPYGRVDVEVVDHCNN